MRLIAISTFLILSIKSFSQRDREIFLSGSYQFYDREAVSFGVGTEVNTVWPELSFKSTIESSLRGVMFLNQPGDKEVYGLQSKMILSTKYVGIGLDTRLLFQDNLSRFDAGPEIRVGYKFVWLEYAPIFLVNNNLFRSNSDTETMDFDNVEHNINITLSIPIVRMK